jgi:two-component system KDP operon response regulator KdpE
MLSEAKSASGGHKIALIDDDEMILDLYGRGLAKEFKVLTATNGKEGLELIEQEKPDLILVDLEMPKMSGLQMLRKMKEEGLMNMPVIILTNYSYDEKIAEAIELGAKEYVLKESITPAELIKRIKVYLE